MCSKKKRVYYTHILYEKDQWISDMGRGKKTQPLNHHLAIVESPKQICHPVHLARTEIVNDYINTVDNNIKSISNSNKFRCCPL